MLQKLHEQKKQEGFTIIEVLIVLAIAGLIMLIVFLAVPALQRTQRNTQRTNAVSQIMSSINNSISNTGGTLPTSQATLATAITDYKPGYYLAARVFYGTGTPPAVVAATGTESATTLSTEDVLVYVGYTCSSQTAAPTTTNASARGFAVEYAIEASGSTGTLQCQSS